MYIIRDKNAKSILHIAKKEDFNAPPSPQDVYPEFDPQTMEMAEFDGEEPPAFFDIDEAGKARPLSREEFLELKGRGPGIFRGSGTQPG